MNIKEIIDAQRWDYGYIGHKQHNSSLDRIEAVATKNELMLGQFREIQIKTGERIRELEDELNAYKLKELAAQSEPSTWYDDSLRRRVKDLEAENAKLRSVLSAWSYADKQLREYEKGRGL